MANLVVTLAQAASKIKTAKGITNANLSTLSKEMEVLFGALKTDGADVVEITHRFRNTGKSPFCVLDFQVKDKKGKLLDRLIGSISDWSSSGKAYSIKSRKPSLTQETSSVVDDVANKVDKIKDKSKKVIDDKKPANDKHKYVQGELDFGDDIVNVVKDKTKKDISENKIKDMIGKKVDDNKPQLDNNKPKDIKPTSDKKPNIDDKKPVPDGQKPIAGVLPPETQIIEAPVGLEPHPTQYIPNIRDYEIKALLDDDFNKRLKTINELSQTGRQALFNPMTGEPNVFWTFNREEAVEFFLKLLGRK